MTLALPEQQVGSDIVQVEWDDPLFEGVLELRHAVLDAPERKDWQGILPKDRLPDTIHLVKINDGEVSAALRIECEPAAYQLSRIAVAAECQGQGYGSASVCGAEHRIATIGGGVVWLLARPEAYKFYRSAGYSYAPERKSRAYIPMRKLVPQYDYPRDIGL